MFWFNFESWRSIFWELLEFSLPRFVYAIHVFHDIPCEQFCADFSPTATILQYFVGFYEYYCLTIVFFVRACVHSFFYFGLEPSGSNSGSKNSNSQWVSSTLHSSNRWFPSPSRLLRLVRNFVYLLCIVLARSSLPCDNTRTCICMEFRNIRINFCSVIFVSKFWLCEVHYPFRFTSPGSFSSLLV